MFDFLLQEAVLTPAAQTA